MKYQEFIKSVQLKSGFSDSEAERATEVFMEMLGSRLTGDELKDLSSQLPPEIAGMAQPRDAMQKLHGNEFLEQIAYRQTIDMAHAKKQMHAVWDTLKEAVSEGQLNHIRTQLPDDMADILH